MDILKMCLFVVIIAAVVGITVYVVLGLLCLPYQLARRESRRVTSPDWQELKEALNATAFMSPIFGLFSLSRFTWHPGSSDGDFLMMRTFRYAMDNYTVCFAFLWGGTILFAIVNLLVALVRRKLRHRRELRAAMSAAANTRCPDRPD